MKADFEPDCPKCASYALYRETNRGNYECQTCRLRDIDTLSHDPGTHQRAARAQHQPILSARDTPADPAGQARVKVLPSGAPAFGLGSRPVSVRGR